jgi:Zn-dependent protease
VHLRFNASSIGTNFLTAVVLSLIGVLISSELLLYLALGNLFFGFINSFPITPLDGGWVYEDLVNLHLANKKVKGFFLSARFVIFVLWLLLFTFSCLS